MKKILYLVFIALSIMSLSGCGLIFGDDEYYQAYFKSSERAEEKCEQLIDYINTKDAAGIREMFSTESKKEPSLNNQISDFLKQFPNGMSEYEIGGWNGSHGSYEHWRVELLEESAIIYIPKKGLSSGDEDQCIIINHTFANKDNPERVGVNKIIWINRLTEEEIIIGPVVTGPVNEG